MNLFTICLQSCEIVATLICYIIYRQFDCLIISFSLSKDISPCSGKGLFLLETKFAWRQVKLLCSEVCFASDFANLTSLYIENVKLHRNLLQLHFSQCGKLHFNLLSVTIAFR